MIFVTTGTNEQPFDRLVEAARCLDCPEELLVQYGSSSITAGPGHWEAFLRFDECDAAMRRARAVVTHAGVGSILLALRHGRRPVVMPRRRARREAVDDHQVALADRLAQAGLVVVTEEWCLAEAIEIAVALGPLALGPAAGPPPALVAELRDFVCGLSLS